MFTIFTRMDKWFHILFAMLFCLFLGSKVEAHAQEIKVTGRITSAENGTVPTGTIIVIKHRGTGAFADLLGNFSLTMKKSDTLLISARNYEVKRYVFSDSDTVVYLDVRLSIPTNILRPVVVKPIRPVSEVHRDITTIRKELPSRPTGLDALSSPISAIYGRFSKMARSKELVAEFEYRDKKNDLLKELFQLYVDADIISLSPDEFDDFIMFCQPPDYWLRNAKEYELINYFQAKFRQYVNRFIRD